MIQSQGALHKTEITKFHDTVEFHDLPAITVLRELPRRREHDKGQVDITQHGQLVGLLDKPIPTLGIRHLPVGGILDLLNL